MPAPWTIEKRDRIKRKIDKEAARAAGRLGAKAAVLIVFFEDGNEYLHIQDGGVAPMPLIELYRKLSGDRGVMDQSVDDGVTLN
jgi:hypothetical protein